MRLTPPTATASRANRPSLAFTLIELLVVIAIIGLLMAVGIPAFKGFGKSNAIVAADRQLLDDLAFARQRAIADHTTVFLLFLPPTNSTFLSSFTGSRAWMQTQVTNLLQQQYATYAFYEERSVGDQPGQKAGRYLTTWKTLPEGIFIAEKKFQTAFAGIAPFNTDRLFPFPTVVSNSVSLPLPYLEFNYLGQLVTTNASG
ncbi:MAG: prepilin-type N-terminal cleavage/methylation domain-containing protein, partial [Verrucomicrobia bacterium]|nr:prepilin-type N-terminal cleavage/methylation domain-containing protein [Verrucomicrobiota bacterium]